jgi:predicted AAA+ superfamily ATPase
MIKRQLEKQLQKTFRLFPAVAILGPRQVGKTTLAKQIAKALAKKIIYLDLENPEDAFILQNPVAFFRENKTSCIIIDEVQRMPSLFPVLRSMIDEHRKPGRFIITGSASPELLLKSAETLAGRIFYHELTPFTIAEIQEKYKQEKLLLRGGFPQPFLAKTNEAAALWQQSFLTTYIERDLPQLGLSVSPILMRRLMQMLAHHHGQIINYSQLANALGISSPTVTRAVDYLENAFLVRRLPPYFANSKKRLIKSPKIYIRDTGVLLNLLKITTITELLSHPQCGMVWEGFVNEQILAVHAGKYEGYFYRTQDGTEADLVLLKAGKPFIFVESKFSNHPTITAGTYNAITDLKTRENFIITPGPHKVTVTDAGKLQLMALSGFLQKI